jgi:hypothetical protein
MDCSNAESMSDTCNNEHVTVVVDQTSGDLEKTPNSLGTAIDQFIADLGTRIDREEDGSSKFSMQSDVDASLMLKYLEELAASEHTRTLEHILVIEVLLERYSAGVVEDASRRRVKSLQLLLEVKSFIAMTPNERLEYPKKSQDIGNIYVSSAQEFERWNGRSEIQDPTAADPDDKPISTTGIFAYSQLSKDDLEIRLLELLPGSQNDPIECTLSTTTLQNKSSFEALSYTWGNPQGPQGSITVDGVQMLVSQNLFDALFHLRVNTKPRTLWIDAICINQIDMAERTHQVQLMARIYGSAHTVLVWLGPNGNDSDFVMDLVHKVDQGKLNLDDEAFKSNRFLRSINAFMERPWWSRVWVIQEVAMAVNDPLLCCGFSSVSWKPFPAIIEKGGLSTPLALPETLQAKVDNQEKGLHWLMTTFIRDIDWLLSRKGGDIYDLFLVSQRYEATDPRDMIFALYGFFGQPYQSILVPDYTLSTEFVFILATTVLVIFRENLALFERYSIARNTSLPSWVPDFACQNRGSSPYDPITFSTACSSASGDLPAVVHALQFGQLGIEGFQFDTVVEVYDFGTPDDGPFPFFAKVYLLAELAKKSQQKEVDSGCSTFRFSYLRSKEPTYSLFRFVTIGDGSEASIEAAREYEESSDLFIDLYELQHQDPNFVFNNGLTVSEMLLEFRQWHEESWLYSLLHRVLERKLFITSLGFIGIGVPTVQEGDLVTILFGIKTPFVIRDHGGYQTFVGASRVGGVMDGELIPFYEEGLFQKRLFIIH